MLRTVLTDRLSLEAPIIGAPMAGVAGGELAAAVSAGGGLGLIGVGSATRAEFIHAEAGKARESGQRFGVGLMAWALAGRPEQFDATIEADPALVSVSFGAYEPWVERLRDAGIPSVTQVGDTEEAKAAAACGVDFLVARGSEAGGHGRDRIASLPLLQSVLDAVDVPVIAAGGISTGRGLAAVLAAGAVGAWVGTAFVASPEGIIPAAARARAIAAAETDTVYTSVFDIAQHIDWPDGYPGRAIRNDFWSEWAGREEDLASSRDAAEQLEQARRSDDYDRAYVYAGQGVGLVREEVSATSIVAALCAEAEQLLARWGRP